MDRVRLHEYCDEARSFIQSGEYNRTINIARHILQEYPRHIESYRLLGKALLEAGNYQEAGQQFRRVLSANPEDVVSRVGLSRIHEAAGNLNKAAWHMQRAADLSPADSDLRQQLQRLTNTQQSDVEESPEITRAALGRIYARGGLYAKAVQEFKAVVAQQPERTDVQVALAEVLWQAGRHSEAVEVGQHILKTHPNILKANLVVGVAWLESQQPDKAEFYLQLAQELDPENIVAQSFLGEQSPLALRTIEIERLSDAETESKHPLPPPTLPGEDAPAPPESEVTADQMSELHEEETALMSDEERPDEELELPDWLQGLGDDLLDEDMPSGAPSADDSSDDDDTMEWLRGLVERTSEAAQSTGEATPQPPPGQPEPGAEPLPIESDDTDTLGWLDGLRSDTPPEEPQAVEPPQETPAVSETPDWLSSIMAGEPSDAISTDMPAEPPEEPPLGMAEEVDMPSVSPQEPESAVLEPMSGAVEESTVPDWLREIASGESVPSAEESPADEAEPIRPLPEIADEPVAGADEGRALWEQILAEEGVDLTSAEETLPAGAEGMSAEEWLRSTVDISRAEPKPTQAPSEPTLEPPPAEAPAPEVEHRIIQPIPSADLMAEDEDLPDWLAEVRETPDVEMPSEIEAEPADTFDWLSEFREPAAEPELEASPPAEEPLRRAEAQIEEESLPDWLREPTLETAESDVLPADKVPDWLIDLETEEMPLAEPSLEEPIELETGEMPEWLGEVMSKDTPLEEWGEPEATEEAQMPDWLREFREDEQVAKPEAFPQVEFETPADVEAPDEMLQTAMAEGEAAPELPDWLRRLREGESEAEFLAEAEEITPEPAEAPIKVLAEPETMQPEAEGPEWLDDLVRDEESLAELEAVEEEMVSEVTLPIPDYVEVEGVELPPPQAPEPVAAEPPSPEPKKEAPPPEPAPVAEEQPVTRHLEPLRVEDLPEDAEARLTMARAALNAGDWTDALLIYEALVSSSELLDRVIEDLEVGLRRHPDDPIGYQLLGDACMKDGRLQEALRTYRTALTKL